MLKLSRGVMIVMQGVLEVIQNNQPIWLNLEVNNPSPPLEHRLKMAKNQNYADGYNACLEVVVDYFRHLGADIQPIDE